MGAITLPRGALFGFVQPANAAALTEALPAPTRDVRYVRLNAALIADKRSPFWQTPGAGRFTVPLPDGTSATVEIDGSRMEGANAFTSTGKVAGRPLSQAVFAFNKGFLHASIDDPELGSFVLRAATAEVSQFYKVDPSLLALCGGQRQPVVDANVLAAARSARAAQVASADSAHTGTSPETAAATNTQPAEVHVLMVYTPGVLPTMTGSARVDALQSAFLQAIAKVNNTFAASLISARLKLVRIAESTYAPDAGTGSFVTGLQDKALTALQNANDGQMDEIHALRDQAGADLVCLALNRRDASSIGLSYVLDEPGLNFNPHFAFSVVEYASMTTGSVLAHEFGHVLGCVHDRENSSGDSGAYPYSYGYRFFGADGIQYRDIMAYAPGRELGYFSNPNVTVPAPVSRPIGVPAGQPGEADAARTIEQNAFEAATFRLQTQAAANAGTLINVATRAFVGTGDQVLIGGFVVNGAQAKTVLLRAAGPALTAFGVPNVLADPIINVFSGSSRIAGNDNWGTQENGSGSAVAAASNQVNAFAFPAGSSDAALVMTLPAGSYTAIVSGQNGATGTGLVEVYDVDRSAIKVVNLSSRAYADRNGKEMFGGFVVQGTAGTTKRILVRVLGPTLGRAPFMVTGSMEDPYMEIRNAAGELLILNDDWSTGAVGGASAENDFRPTVRHYNEQQIFATSFAPSNRREPAVMVDLLPGNYTVIVKPFELRDPNPDLEQIAKPGVAIVEVFEINP